MLECLEFLNSLRYTKTEIKRLNAYEFQFILERAEEEKIKGMREVLDGIINGTVDMKKSKKMYGRADSGTLRINSQTYSLNL